VLDEPQAAVDAIVAHYPEGDLTPSEAERERLLNL